MRSAETGGFHSQVLWNANVTADAKRQYWANYVETGPGVRFRFDNSPLLFSVSMLRGAYLVNEYNPRRPNYSRAARGSVVCVYSLTPGGADPLVRAGPPGPAVWWDIGDQAGQEAGCGPGGLPDLFSSRPVQVNVFGISVLVAPCALGATVFVPSRGRGSWSLAGDSFFHRPDAGPRGVVVVQLSDSAASDWAARVEAGTILVLEGDSPFAASFGFRAGSERVSVQGMEDVHAPQLRIVWEKALDLPVFEIPKDARCLQCTRAARPLSGWHAPRRRSRSLGGRFSRAASWPA